MSQGLNKTRGVCLRAVSCMQNGDMLYVILVLKRLSEVVHVDFIIRKCCWDDYEVGLWSASQGYKTLFDLIRHCTAAMNYQPAVCRADRFRACFSLCGVSVWAANCLQMRDRVLFMIAPDYFPRSPSHRATHNHLGQLCRQPRQRLREGRRIVPARR